MIFCATYHKKQGGEGVLFAVLTIIFVDKSTCGNYNRCDMTKGASKAFLLEK